MARARQSKADKVAEARVTAAYNAVAEGVQINVLDLGKIHDAGMAAVKAGGDDEAVRSAVREAVTKFRLN